MSLLLRLTTFALLAFLGPGTLQGRAAEIDFSKAQWEKISDDDGIETYRWDVPDSPVFAFKAIAVIDAPCVRVGSILVDLDHAMEWTPDLVESRLIRQISPVERIEYSHFRTPIFVKDRDFVLQGRADFDPVGKKLTISFHSVEDPAAPLTDRVRGEIQASSYTMSPVDDGKKTLLVLLAHVDPKGTVPKLLVNLFQKNFPRHAIEAIRKRAEKTDIPSQPLILKVYQDRPEPAPAVSPSPSPSP
jgi:hypothetical protein